MSEQTPDGLASIARQKLDPDALRVVARLCAQGHEAYLVGGCVRDLLLGRVPKDFDIATSATPKEVRNLFRNSRLIGRRFRLVQVFFQGGRVFEVSTFRAAPTYVEEPTPRASGVPEGELPPPEAEDKPEPDLLVLEDNNFGTALDDARRRDFTINGLFYDPSNERILDYVHGLRDLHGREIRTIGNPEKRMREDPVRILRAVRFVTKLGFDVEPRTYAAMEGAVEDLARCSAPRLVEETFRLLRGGIAAPSMRLLDALRCIDILMPPIGKYLASCAPEEVNRYWKLLAAMDEVVSSGSEYDDAMTLATLLLPFAFEAAPAPEGKNQPGVETIDAAIQALLDKARFPRRISERCRLIILAQRTLAGQRRRRRGLVSFRDHPIFSAALTVFGVWVQATGNFEEALAQWKTGGAPAPASDAPGPRRKRRRRRHRSANPGGEPSAA